MLVVINSNDDLETMTLADPDQRSGMASILLGAGAEAELNALSSRPGCGGAGDVLARLDYDPPPPEEPEEEPEGGG